MYYIKRTLYFCNVNRRYIKLSQLIYEALNLFSNKTIKKMNYLSKVIPVMVLLSTILCSCSNEMESSISEKKTGKFDNNANKVISIVKNYSKSLSPGLTKAGVDLKILRTRLEVFNLKVNKTENITTMQTRSLDIPDSVGVNLYTVEFMKDDKPGFAIVGSDENIERVYAYTESGSIADTAKIPALAYTLNNIKYICRDDIVKAILGLSTNYAKASLKMSTEVYFPQLHSMANIYPFNKYFPKSDCTFNSEYQGYMSSHWTAIVIATCADYMDNNCRTQSDADGFARKFYEVASRVPSNINCYPYPHGTSANFPLTNLKIYLETNYPNRWELETKVTRINVNKVITTMQNSMPIAVWTNSAIYAEMTWILNGGHFIIGANDGNHISDLYCLWGWDGICDGWYVNYYQPADNNYPYTEEGKGLKQFMYFKK